MESKLLDSAFGKRDSNNFVLEQIFVCSKGGYDYLAKVTVRWCNLGADLSDAKVVLLSDEGEGTSVVLSEFPSRWWAQGGGVEGVEQDLNEVAARLQARMATVLDALR